MESDCERVLAVLDSCGIEYRRETNGRAKVCCPFHEEKTPSMTIYDDNSCYCYGCQKYCWHDELVAKFANCSVVEAKKKLGIFDPNVQYVPQTSGKLKITNYEFADVANDYTDIFNKLSTDVPAHMQKFLEDKALWDVATKQGNWRWHNKGDLPQWPNQEGIAIPYYGANGKICAYRLRRYDRMREKFEHPLAPKGISLQCSYMMHNLTDPVYFCEGESDSMSMYSIGKNVVCLPGVGAHKQLHSAIMQCLEWGVPKLIFCGDNDTAGNEFNDYAIKAAMALGMGLFVPQLRKLKLPQEYNLLSTGAFKRKDINDFLKEGRLEQIIKDWEYNDDRGKRSFKQTAKKESKQYDVIKQIFGDYTELTKGANYGD